MLKACGKCGRIHDYNYKCRVSTVKHIRTADDRLRSTSAWQKKREDIKERSKWLCAVCLVENIYTYDNLEVHHIKKLKDEPDKLLDDANLICLCKEHHEEADSGKISDEYLARLVKQRDGAMS